MRKSSVTLRITSGAAACALAAVVYGAANLSVQTRGPQSGHVRLAYGVQSLPVGAPLITIVMFEIAE